MRLKCSLAIWLTVTSYAIAGPEQCPDPGFQVEASDESLTDRTCQSASKARGVLESCGITVPKPIEIYVSPSIEGGMENCLGLYHCGKNRIEILTPQSMALAREEESAFAGIAEDAFWDSVLVHELTHAAYDRVECPFSSCIASSEYAAYVMQVFSLSPQNQKLFGQSIELKSKPTRDGLAAIVYFMAPDRFAKTAWLHFNGRPDPCGYLSQVINGDIFFDREPL